MTSTISEGTPDKSVIVTGLPATGMRSRRPMTGGSVSRVNRPENMKAKRRSPFDDSSRIFSR